jgi:integrase
MERGRDALSKKTRPLPSILSPEEVAHLIDSARTRFHRMVLMTLYGTGTRRAELARLQIPDIDSRRMVTPSGAGKVVRTEISCSVPYCWKPCPTPRRCVPFLPPSQLSVPNLGSKPPSYHTHTLTTPILASLLPASAAVPQASLLTPNTIAYA